MIIGFCNGDFHRLYEDELDRFSQKISQKFFDSGANLIELMVRDEKSLDHLLEMGDDAYDIFTYRLMHAPTYAYSNDDASHRLIDKIADVCKKFDLHHVVFHPDTVQSWSVVTRNQNISVVIENMDEQKSFGRSVEDIASIMDNYPVNLIIDLQHCYVNDRSMRLSRDFHERFHGRIAGYHISGFHKNFLHYPLFKTQQDCIIESLKIKDVPITIESTFDGFVEAEKELNYIIKNISI